MAGASKDSSTLPPTPDASALSLFAIDGVAAVTGGTRGLGRACAIALAQAGADIVLLQRNVEDRAVHDTIVGLGRRCAIVQCDLADHDRVRNVWAEVEAALGPVSILVQAGGIQRRAPSVDFSEADWDEVNAVNLKTPWLLSQAAGRKMVERGYGRIVLFGSLMTFQGGLNVPAYAASKGAIGQLTKALANEWTRHGVLVNAIAPGYVATDMNTALRNDPVRMAQLDVRIPAGRWGKPEDFAGPTVFLCSAAAQYVAGTTLIVDGVRARRWRQF